MTYLLMSLPFLGVALAVFAAGLVRARTRSATGRYVRAWGLTTAILLLLTAVFDNLMMAAGFFDYGASEISGLRLGLIPLEDFFYPIAAALLLSGVWELSSRKKPEDV